MLNIMKVDHIGIQAVLSVFLMSVFLAHAEDSDLRQVFLDFESAYMSNDADRFSAWIAEDYEIRQTLHIPGTGADYRPVTKGQLIASMRVIDQPSLFPRSDINAVTIESETENQFCGTSETLHRTVVRGEDYLERERRTVCFRREHDWYLAVEHTINVYISMLPTPAITPGGDE